MTEDEILETMGMRFRVKFCAFKNGAPTLEISNPCSPECLTVRTGHRALFVLVQGQDVPPPLRLASLKVEWRTQPSIHGKVKND
ncbi:hypothetical protein SASPL_128352 [Salvia splendens]|uniref:Uncharacterized protein n=1 Tax=Salvia splendens TaxID=180675 RepID=A0A8X8ZNE6_SALSN|nr:hypothetical protein SASPL_128352 [Salvia splendens]